MKYSRQIFYSYQLAELLMISTNWMCIVFAFNINDPQRMQKPTNHDKGTKLHERHA